MEKDLKIPENLQAAFRRLLTYVPPELRDDSRMLRMMRIYLEIGGANLVRQHVEIAKLRLAEQKRPMYPPLERICPDDQEDPVLDDDED